MLRVRSDLAHVRMGVKLPASEMNVAVLVWLDQIRVDKQAQARTSMPVSQ